MVYGYNWILRMPSFDLCPYTNLAYSIALTMVHSDGTSTLSLYNISFLELVTRRFLYTASSNTVFYTPLPNYRF
jgi:hypothetical protein